MPWLSKSFEEERAILESLQQKQVPQPEETNTFQQEASFTTTDEEVITTTSTTNQMSNPVILEEEQLQEQQYTDYENINIMDPPIGIETTTTTSSSSTISTDGVDYIKVLEGPLPWFQRVSDPPVWQQTQPFRGNSYLDALQQQQQQQQQPDYSTIPPPPPLDMQQFDSPPKGEISDTYDSTSEILEYPSVEDPTTYSNENYYFTYETSTESPEISTQWVVNDSYSETATTPPWIPQTPVEEYYEYYDDDVEEEDQTMYDTYQSESYNSVDDIEEPGTLPSSFIIDQIPPPSSTLIVPPSPSIVQSPPPSSFLDGIDTSTITARTYFSDVGVPLINYLETITPRMSMRRPRSYAPTKRSIKFKSAKQSRYLMDLKTAMSIPTSYPMRQEIKTTAQGGTSRTGEVLKTSAETVLNPDAGTEAISSSDQYVAPNDWLQRNQDSSALPGAIPETDYDVLPSTSQGLEVIQYEPSALEESKKPSVSSTSSVNYLDLITTDVGDLRRQKRSYAQTKRSIKFKSAKQSGYLMDLKTATSIPITYSIEKDSSRTYDDSTPTPKQKSYAMTNPNIKSVKKASSSGSYLDSLYDTNLIETTPPVSDTEPALPPPSFERLDSSKTKKSYSMTNPNIKNVPSSSGSTYLERLNQGIVNDIDESNGNEFAETNNANYAVFDQVAKKSYAMTKPSVKDVSSLSGPYLASLKSATTETSQDMEPSIGQFTGITSTPLQQQQDTLFGLGPLPNIDAPAKKSYAMTKPAVKTVRSSSGSYLDALDDTDVTRISPPLLSDEQPDEQSLPTDINYKSSTVKKSYSMTKPTVKYLSSSSGTSSNYLDRLEQPMVGQVKPFHIKDDTDDSDTNVFDPFKTIGVENQDETKTGQSTKKSYVMTKPSIKGVSSLASGPYLASLRSSRTFEATSSQASEPSVTPFTDITPSPSQQEQPLDAMFAVGQSRNIDSPGKKSYAMTNPAVKTVKSSSGSYLDTLDGTGFACTSGTSISDQQHDQPDSTDEYVTTNINLPTLEEPESSESTSDASSSSSHISAPSVASLPGLPPAPMQQEQPRDGALGIDKSQYVGLPTGSKKSYAMTNPAVKTVKSSSGSYLDALDDTGLPSTSSDLNDPPRDNVMPSTTKKSYSMTKPTVKFDSSSSGSGYLDGLTLPKEEQPDFLSVKEEMGEDSTWKVMSSAIRNEDVTRTTPPITKKSYAMTKPTIKGVSSSSSGPYLELLRSSGTDEPSSSLASELSSAPFSGPPATLIQQEQARDGILGGDQSRNAELPSKKSYAMTNLAVKKVKSSSGSYLDTLDDTGLPSTSSKLNDPPRDNDVMTSTTKKSYSMTKPTVKFVSTSSGSGYLDGLTLPKEEQPDFLSVKEEMGEDSTWKEMGSAIRNEDVTRTTPPITKKSYAMTKPTIKGVSSSSSGPYLELLRSSGSYEQSASELSSTSFSSLPATPIQQEQLSDGILGGSQSRHAELTSKKSYAMTNPAVKKVRSSSGSYLDALDDTGLPSTSSQLNDPPRDNVMTSTTKKSYSMTKPTVKFVSSSSGSSYLDGLPLLKEEKRDFLPVKDDVDEDSKWKVMSSAIRNEDVTRTTPPITKKSYAMTKPTIKGVSSSSSGPYLELLRSSGTYEQSSSLASEPSSAPFSGPPATLIQQEQARDGILGGDQSRNAELPSKKSYAMTNPAVKKVKSSSGSYLDTLDDTGLPSSSSKLNDPPRDNDVMTSTTKKSYSMTKPTVKFVSTSSGSGYLNGLPLLKEEQPDLLPVKDDVDEDSKRKVMSSAIRNEDVTRTTPPITKKSYAMTKPTIKGVSSSSSGPYLELLRSSGTYEQSSSLASEPSSAPFSGPPATLIQQEQARDGILGGDQSRNAELPSKKSYGMTNPAVKKVKSSSGSYLDTLDETGLPSTSSKLNDPPRDNDVMTSTTKKSYSMTKPTVKFVSSSSGSGYLNGLTLPREEQPDLLPVKDDVDEDSKRKVMSSAIRNEDVTRTTPPITKKSYAMTKPTIKGVSSSSSGPYLELLRSSGTYEQSSSLASEPSSAPFSGPPATLIQQEQARDGVLGGDQSRNAELPSKNSYAMTNPAVKKVKSSSGSYLDALDNTGLTNTSSKLNDPTQDSVLTSTTKKSYSMTKPTVKFVSTSSGSGYLDGFKQTTVEQLDSLQVKEDTKETTSVTLNTDDTKSSPVSKKSYAMTKPSVKGVSSSSSGPYLDLLRSTGTYVATSSQASEPSSAPVMDEPASPFQREQARDGIFDVDESRYFGLPSKKSYAVTNPAVKKVKLSSGSYLDALDINTGLTSPSSKLNDPPRDKDVMTSTTKKSYSMTKPTVKFVSTSSGSGYLDGLKQTSVDQSDSLPVKEDTEETTIVSLNQDDTKSSPVSKKSYAMTKPSVKGVSSLSSGPYLDLLRSTGTYDATSSQASEPSSAPVMDEPVSPFQQEQARDGIFGVYESRYFGLPSKKSYAMTNPSVKKVKSSSGSYLDALDDTGLTSPSSKLNDPTQDSVLPSTTKNSYSMTKPMVKFVSSSSGNNYLDRLQENKPLSSDSLLKDDGSVNSSDGATANVLNPSSGSFLDALYDTALMIQQSISDERGTGSYVKSISETYSMIKPTVELPSTSSGTNSLDILKQDNFGTSSSSDEPLDQQSPFIDSYVTSSTKKSYSMTKPSVKYVRSSSGSNYLDKLRLDIFVKSSLLRKPVNEHPAMIDNDAPSTTKKTNSTIQSTVTFFPSSSGSDHLDTLNQDISLKSALPDEQRDQQPSTDKYVPSATKRSYSMTKPTVKFVLTSSGNNYLDKLRQDTFAKSKQPTVPDSN